VKRIALILTLAAGCTSQTDFGPCIGAFDEKDPALTYKVSGWNIGMGLLFSEFIIPPVVVVVDETFCPVGRKGPAK